MNMRYNACILMVCTFIISCDSSSLDGSLDNQIGKTESNLGQGPVGSILLNPGNANIPLHEVYAQLNKVAPTFGGVYLDDEQVPHVKLTDPANRQDLETLVREFTSVDPETKRLATSMAKYSYSQIMSKVVVEKADYTYSNIWQTIRVLGDKMTDDLAILGFTISNKLNRIVIHVSDVSSIESLNVLLIKDNIDQSMIVIETGKPVVQRQLELNQNSSALAGGFRILKTGSAQGCSMGYVASGVAVESGYVTASHCTLIEGAVDNGGFHQGSPGNLGGYEVADIPWNITVGCPAGGTCRYADAALIRVPYTFDPGRVGKTIQPSGTSPPYDLTLVSSNPSAWFNVVGVIYNQTEGESLVKVGTATGWTVGLVDNPCYVPLEVATNKYDICQVVADYHSVGGDSGGSIIDLTGDENNSIYIHGTHNGSVNIDGKRVGAYFSPVKYSTNYLTASVTM